MGFGKAYSLSLLGLKGTVVEVECDISSNLPSFILVGLPDASLNEAVPRVRSACKNAGLSLPARKITVNLSPASIPKFGSGFDLSIALAVLAAAGEIQASELAGWLHLGELGLDSSLRPIRGILPALVAARQLGHMRFVVPFANLAEAKLIAGIEVFGAECLADVLVHHGHSGAKLRRPSPQSASEESKDSKPKSILDVSEVVGQELAITALTVAAAGGHHLLMIGPPGAGKTMLAERLPGILPDLTTEQALETSAIYSLANAQIGQRSLMVRPPFVAPHHSSSMTSLVGGGLGSPRPGAISLAHNGVLFLDETPEFQSTALESLRQPLESGVVTIARSKGSAEFPANFQLVLAANPCPCGKVGTSNCSCSSQQLIRYSSKLSGPLLDRVDIQLHVQSAKLKLLREPGISDLTSASIRQRVSVARSIAADRLKQTEWSTNSRVSGAWLRSVGRLPSKMLVSLNRALDREVISMRGYDRCLRLAWTLADLDGKTVPDSNNLAMAMYLRGVDSLG